MKYFDEVKMLDFSLLQIEGYVFQIMRSGMIGEPLPIGFPKFWEKISRLKEWYVYGQTVCEAHLEILHAPP